MNNLLSVKTVGKVRPKRVQRAGGQLRRCTSSLLSRACHGSFWQQCGAVAVAPVLRLVGASNRKLRPLGGGTSVRGELATSGLDSSRRAYPGRLVARKTRRGRSLRAPNLVSQAKFFVSPGGWEIRRRSQSCSFSKQPDSLHRARSKSLARLFSLSCLRSW